MNYEYIKDENGVIVDIKVEGKPIKRGALRGWTKAQKTPYFRLATQDTLARNPLSKVTKVLNPLETTVYNFCMEWYRLYSAGDETSAPVQTFDDMKYFLMDLNSDAYYELLD